MDKAERFRRLTCVAELRKDLRGRSVRAAAFSGTSAAVDFAIRIGSTAVLARLVLPQHFGLVMMVSAVTSIADQFRDLGLSAATVQRKEISHAEVSNMFWVNCLAGLLIALVICAVSPLLAAYYKEPRLTSITCLLATNCILGGMMVQHQALLTRQLKLGHTSTIRLLSSLLSTLLAIALAWMDFGYWALIWREIARSALLTGGMWFCCPWIPSWPCRKTNIRSLVHFGANLTGANILATISASVDRLLIGAYWGAGPVAMYRQAFQLVSTPIDQLTAPVCQVAEPGLSRLQSDDTRYRRFYQKILTVVSLGTMPISLFVAVYSPEITSLVLGGKWNDSAPILMILSFGAFIKLAVGTAAFVLITTGRSKIYLALTAAQNAAIVVLMLTGVRWGPTGVAVADVLTTYLFVWPRLHYCFRGSPITIGNFFSTIATPAIASVMMAGALILFRLVVPLGRSHTALAIGCLIGAAVFCGSWLLLPGGASKLKGLFADLQAAVGKKTTPVVEAAAPVGS